MILKFFLIHLSLSLSSNPVFLQGNSAHSKQKLTFFSLIQISTIQSELLHFPSLQPLQFTLAKCSKTSLKLPYLVNTGVDFEYALTTDSYDSNKREVS